MLTYLSLCALPLAALGRHVITQRSRTARLRLALHRTRPSDRASIIRACSQFELGQKASQAGQEHTDEN